MAKGDRIRITSEAFHSPAFKQGKTGTITANAVMVIMDNGQPGTLYEGEYEIISQTPLADPDPKP